jgi:hypothetical protein
MIEEHPWRPMMKAPADSIAMLTVLDEYMVNSRGADG